MLVVYEGPPDSYDAEVAQALVLGREHTTVELPDNREGAAENATILATDPASDASGWLEPGRVYDLPPRLAEARLETSAWWAKVTKIADLTDEQLRRLAAERGVEGRSKMSGKELAKAVSSATPATLPDPSPPSEAPAGGDTSPATGTTTPGAPDVGTTATAAGAATAGAATTTPTPGGNP